MTFPKKRTHDTVNNKNKNVGIGVYRTRFVRVSTQVLMEIQLTSLKIFLNVTFPVVIFKRM